MNQIIFNYLNNLAGKSYYFDLIIIFFAQYFPYLVVASIIFFWIFGKDKKRKMKFVIFSFFSAIFARFVVTEAIRYFDNVSRPFVDNNVNQLIFHETSNSFPSGHATFFFALATAVALGHSVSKRTLSVPIIFFIAAIFISIFRVMAGIHWPLDILGGAIVGILTTYLMYLIFNKKLQK